MKHNDMRKKKHISMEGIEKVVICSTYPETKTPVPRRKIKAREPPRMSKFLSGLTEKGFGCGGLKFGGGENEGPELVEGSSLVLTDVDAAICVSEDQADNST